MEQDRFPDLINRLQIRYRKALPGHGAQRRMAPVHRKSMEEYLAGSENYKTAAVMVLLVPGAANPPAKVILMERTSGPDVHAGQISFPGGKQEHDETLLDTALRETEEELGLRASAVTVIGPMTSLFIPASNFFVQPFLGFLPEVPEMAPSAAEVNRVLMPDLHLFSSGMEIQEGIFHSSKGFSVQAPYFRVEGVRIWGATAMMIAEMAALLEE